MITDWGIERWINYMSTKRIRSQTINLDIAVLCIIQMQIRCQLNDSIKAAAARKNDPRESISQQILQACWWINKFLNVFHQETFQQKKQIKSLECCSNSRFKINNRCIIVKNNSLAALSAGRKRQSEKWKCTCDRWAKRNWQMRKEHSNLNTFSLEVLYDITMRAKFWLENVAGSREVYLKMRLKIVGFCYLKFSYFNQKSLRWLGN